MSLHLVDGFTNFATFLVPAILLALADRVRPRKQAEPEATSVETTKEN